MHFPHNHAISNLSDRLIYRMGLAIIFIALFHFVACQEDDARNEIQNEKVVQGTIDLKLTDSFILDPGDKMIGKFREKMHVNAEGTVLTFVDELRNQIFLFNNQGKLLQVIGNAGSGPKEFMRISGFFVDEKDRLIVVDISLLTVKVFDLSGELLSTFPIFDNQNLNIASRNVFVHDDILYIQIYEPSQAHDKKNSKLIARYNLNGDFIDLIGKFDPYLENSKHYLLGHNFTVDPEKNQLISNLETSPYIQLFNIPETKFVKNFGGNSTFWKHDRERIEPGMPRAEIMNKAIGNTYSQGLFFSGDFIFNHIQEMTEDWFYSTGGYLDKKNYVLAYDRATTKYVGSTELNGYLGYVNGKQMYLIEDFDPDNFKISVYEISVI